MPGADGKHAIKVTVTAVPEGGKANAAVIKLLAKAWGMPRSAIEVVVGATDRRKVLHVAGHPHDLMHRLGRWLDDLIGAE